MHQALPYAVSSYWFILHDLMCIGAVLSALKFRLGYLASRSSWAKLLTPISTNKPPFEGGKIIWQEQTHFNPQAKDMDRQDTTKVTKEKPWKFTKAYSIRRPSLHVSYEGDSRFISQLPSIGSSKHLLSRLRDGRGWQRIEAGALNRRREDWLNQISPVHQKFIKFIKKNMLRSMNLRSWEEGDLVTCPSNAEMVVPTSPLNTWLTTLDVAKIRFTPSDVLDFLSKVLHTKTIKTSTVKVAVARRQVFPTYGWMSIQPAPQEFWNLGKWHFI